MMIMMIGDDNLDEGSRKGVKWTHCLNFGLAPLAVGYFGNTKS